MHVYMPVIIIKRRSSYVCVSVSVCGKYFVVMSLVCTLYIPAINNKIFFFRIYIDNKTVALARNEQEVVCLKFRYF